MRRRVQVFAGQRRRGAIAYFGSFGALFICASGSICACGGNQAPAAAPAVSTPPVAEPAATTTGASTQTLVRSVVRAAVAQGLGALLQHVEVDAVHTGGRFHGFRIAALRGAAFWSGVDLKPGDVVTSVNGFPIERPEQAQTAFESLGVASELRVSYDRDGEPRELVYRIVDDH